MGPQEGRQAVGFGQEEGRPPASAPALSAARSSAVFEAQGTPPLSPPQRPANPTAVYRQQQPAAARPWYDPLGVGEKIRTASLYANAVTYPLRAGRGSGNRLFSLLTWDAACCWGCAALFVAMLTASEWTKVRLEAAEAGVKLSVDAHALAALSQLAGNVFSASYYRDWRTQITFAIVRLLFTLTALPFFIFTIGPFAKLFARAAPTAFTREGRCVQPDTTGLGAYLQWLKSDVLHNPSCADELNHRFPQRDLKRLNRAVAEGEQVLSSAWSRPGTAKRVMMRKKKEIDTLLNQIITADKASPALYNRCFPDHILVAQYEATHGEQKHAEGGDN